MTEAVIVALITGAVSMLGSIITAVSASRLTAYRLEELKTDFNDLRERVNRHNQVVERLAIAEESTRSAHRRIDELKGGR